MSNVFVAPRSLPPPDPYATGASPGFTLPGSCWTDDVPATPTVKAKSATVVANLLTQGYGAGGASANFSISGSDGVGRFVVHGQQIAATYGWTTMNTNPGDYWDDAPIGIDKWPVPQGWVNSSGTDHEVAIWDKDNYTRGSYTGPMAYCGWGFHQNGNPGAGYNAIFPGGLLVEMIAPANGTYGGFGSGGIDSLDSGVATASGAPYFATNISYAEWLYGTIEHALALTIGTPTKEAYSPAQASDGSGALSSSAVPYGSLFYFPPGTVEPDWATTGSSSPALAHMVFVAIQTYGMYAVDQTVGQGCDLQAESYQAWARYDPAMQFDGVHWPLNLDTAYNAFKGMPWSSLVNIVPKSQLGTGGGGSTTFPAGGASVGYTTTSAASIPVPSTTAVGDTLVLYCVFAGQAYNSGTPTGWTLLTPGNADKAGTNFACYTKTAASGDIGASIVLGFAGTGLFWNIVDVKGSTGASLSQLYQDYDHIATHPAALSSGQNLTLLFVGVSTNTTVQYWPDRYTQINWLQAAWSGGCASFSGAAYGNDAFIPNSGGQSNLGIQIAV